MALKIDTVRATKLWERGLSAREMAKELGCTEKGVSNFMERNGMGSNRGIFDWQPSDFVDNSPRRYSKRGI